MKYKIKVGNLVKIKRGMMKGSFKIMYCGMSNKETFVLSPHVAHGYSGYSPNIYYSIGSILIQILDMEFAVIEVTQDYIILEE